MLLLIGADVGDVYARVFQPVLPDWAPEELAMPQWLIPYVLWGAIGLGILLTFHDALRSERATPKLQFKEPTLEAQLALLIQEGLKLREKSVTYGEDPPWAMAGHWRKRWIAS